ncbi:hypothetical protein [Nonomuraea endophytica]|uniref:Uncharacterized protein n=1 Tax=Nonomuraea endophytica TaxID=714136 RepID=A0A7W8AA78_9ACTN|nr:hypothetical protein [Nonomuraea endophytica]MBB5081471.1 hypothetical protein [Nonomuraea endophytica]
MLGHRRRKDDGAAGQRAGQGLLRAGLDDVAHHVSTSAAAVVMPSMPGSARLG